MAGQHIDYSSQYFWYDFASNIKLSFCKLQINNLLLIVQQKCKTKVGFIELNQNSDWTIQH